MKKYDLGRTLAAVLALTTGSGALAQSGERGSASDEEGGITEIVVTAQKRAENLQDTPISILALGSDSLQQRGVNSLSDLFTGSVPSLRIAPFLGRASAVSIGMRGLVPVDATQVTRDPTVGIYIDGVYVGRVSGLGMELSDVERIEVLRGPQGTLFGRNTIGGAVSVVTKRPTGEFGADVRGGFGNYGSRMAAAHLNLPRIAGVAIKLDGLYSDRGGLVLNPDPTFLDYSEIRKYGFKATAHWEPVNNVSILYSYDQSHDKSTSNYSDITATDQAASLRPSFITLREGRVRTGLIGVPVLRNPQRARGHGLGHRPALPRLAVPRHVLDVVPHPAGVRVLVLPVRRVPRGRRRGGADRAVAGDRAPRRAHAGRGDPALGEQGREHAMRKRNQREEELPANLDGVFLGEEKARKVASKLRAGQVSINGGGGDMMAPFGGYKMSGNGREWGDYAFHEFLETKAVLVPKQAAE
mgnify:CR=1 FL=1